jgi:hypothetical protein
MATQLEVLRLIAPEFTGIPDASVQAFLDLAPLFIDPMAYPEESRGLALVYMACSLMYDRGLSASGASNGGQLVREREGDLERQYSQASQNGGSVKSLNIYMQQLKNLGMGVFGSSIMTRVV